MTTVMTCPHQRRPPTEATASHETAQRAPRGSGLSGRLAEESPLTQRRRDQTRAEQAVRRVSEQPTELSAEEVEESNLLSVAYKNAVNSRCAPWRVITIVEQKERTKGNEQQAACVRECVVKVEAELEKICEGILALMDKKIIHSAGTRESEETTGRKVATASILRSLPPATQRARPPRMLASRTQKNSWPSKTELSC